MGFSVIVAFVPCEHLDWIHCNLFVSIKIAVAILGVNRPLTITVPGDIVLVGLVGLVVLVARR